MTIPNLLFIMKSIPQISIITEREIKYFYIENLKIVSIIWIMEQIPSFLEYETRNHITYNANISFSQNYYTVSGCF